MNPRPSLPRPVLALVGLLALLALMATACGGSSKKTDDASSGPFGSISRDSLLAATSTLPVGSDGLSGGSSGTTPSGGSAGSGSKSGTGSGGNTSSGGGNGQGGSSAVGSDPGSPYCGVATTLAPTLYDATDPESASGLRQLQAVAPAEIADSLRYLLDVNKQVADLDINNLDQVNALDAVLQSGDVEDAGVAIDSYTLETCGFDMNL